MSIVITGAGPCGVRVAEILRKEGLKEEIVMLTKEPFPPYSPPLMADYLESRGKSELIFFKGKDFCESLDIKCLTGVEASGLDVKNKMVILKDGTEIPYKKLVIATGSELFMPLKIEKGASYYNFKSLKAVEELLQRVEKGADKAVIIGGGFIGIEIAVTLRRIGLQVLVVEMENRILPRMIPLDVAEPLEEILRDMGIELRLNSKAVLLRKIKGKEELLLEDGTTIRGDFFIAATGVKPNVDFLRETPVNVRRGIPVTLRQETNIPNIYAGGDVAEVKDLITGNEYPHAIYPEALKQGEVIAYNILGERVEYEGGVNMNSLYHFKLPLISEGVMIGEIEPDEEIVFKKGNIIRKISIKDGKLLRFELVGDKKGAGLLHTLLIKRENVENIKYDLVLGRYNQAHYVLSSLHPGFRIL